MNEITLMDAIHRMYVHKDKKSPIRFLVTFDDGITRKASFGKSWSKTMKTWTYFVQDVPMNCGMPTRSVRQFQQSC